MGHHAFRQTAQETLAANKGMLAKLLASENLTIIHDPKASTASFDTHARILTLPVWEDISADLYDMIVLHEVGHALFTLEEEWTIAIRKLAEKHYPKCVENAMPRIHQVINVLEDPRIEKLMKRKYAGARGPMIRGYKELWDRDFFNMKKYLNSGKKISEIGFVDRINIYCKVGAYVLVSFSEKEKEIMAKVEALETQADVETLADEIIQMVRNDIAEQKAMQNARDKAPKGQRGQQGQQGQQGQKGEKGQSSKGDKPSEQGEEGEAGAASFENLENPQEGDGKQEGSDGEAEDGKGEGDGDDADLPADTQPEEKDEGKTNKGKVGGTNTSSKDIGDADTTEADPVVEADAESLDALSSFTEKALRDSSGTLATNTIGILNMTSPDYNLKECIHYFPRVMADHKADLEGRMLNKETDTTYNIKKATAWAAKFKIDERRNIAYMMKEFEMRKAAESAIRSRTAKSGRLDMNKLHNYKITEDLFKRTMINHKGQSHGLFFVLDWSGSMSHTIKQLVTSLVSLTLFCRTANIPFEVFIFTDSLSDPQGTALNDRWGYNAYKKNTPSKATASTDLEMSTKFWLRNVLSSKMNHRDYTQAVINLKMLSDGKLGCDRMGGTPLLDSILVSAPLLEEFKKEHNLDHISYVVMTDGDSNAPSRTKAGDFDTLMGYGKSQYRITYTDKVSKRTYVETLARKPGSWDISPAIQRMALKSLQDRFNANLIGYYITNQSFDSLIYKFARPADDEASMRKSWRQNGYLGLTERGYDEYYVINPLTLQAKQGSFASATKHIQLNDINDVFGAFAAHTKQLENSRQILKALITRITARDRM